MPRLDRTFGGSVPTALTQLVALLTHMSASEALKAGTVGAARTERSKLKRLASIGVVTEQPESRGQVFVNPQACAGWERTFALRRAGW